MGKEGLLLRASKAFDVPGDVVAGLPRIELIGAGELRMEQHRGILAYGPEEIHISGGKLVVRVKGSGLELRAMNPTELLITGEIRVVELV
ncbi:MAG: YabP/YqfC family sporulation protein [Oscillospiraceae bacterium]|nr:YabP/YqfC family sporulation protein [Oscillospiraceae bacterium]